MGLEKSLGDTGFTGGLKNNDHTVVKFEKALSLVGFGKYHYCFILTCGAVFFSAGIQGGLNAYVMPSAQCDLQLTAKDMGLLNAIYLVGSTVSSFFWGVLADQVGRKPTLVYSLFFDGLLTSISSLSPNFLVFAMFRFINGFIIGSPGIIVFPYLGEFIGQKHRDMSLCTVGFFWAVSWIVLPAVAWVVIPLSINLDLSFITFSSWRMYVALAGTPALLTSVLLAKCYPESPKFLFSKGQISETLDVLRNIHRSNYGQHSTVYPVKVLLADEETDPNMNQVQVNNKNNKSCVKIVGQVWADVKSLFESHLIGRTFLGALLLSTNMFSFYGLGLWLPEIFNRFEDHYSSSNVSVTVCELVKLSANKSESLEEIMFEELTTDCEASGVQPSVFVNTFIMNVCYLFSNVVLALAAKKFGLRPLCVLTMMIAGVCAGAIYFLNTSLQNLIVSCIFMTFVGVGNTIICSAITELFPTRVRGIGLSWAVFMGRISAVLSNLTLGYILEVMCEVPVFLMAGVLILGGFLGFLLPKKKTEDTPSC